VIENFSNLTLLREGLPIEIAKLHQQTFSQIQYHIKHRYGLGTNHHSHNNPAPIYGVGQGSTDAPARWGFVCDKLINIYKEFGSDAHIYSPFKSTSTNTKIACFVDDSTVMNIKQLIASFLVLLLQNDAQLWERLLYTSGGKLEIPKCVFSIFDWIFDESGRSKLNMATDYNLHIQSSETKKLIVIPQMKPSTAYKYVGIQLALNGQMKSQIEDLSDKCQKMTVIFRQQYFNPSDAKQGFTTIYSPSITYVLPTTSIPRQTLNTIQKPIIHSVLSRLGFNNHMPRAVVYASKLRGGLGLLDLYTEQGNSQIKLIITHLRSRSYLSDSIIILLESFQVAAGIIGSPLVNTTFISYVDSPWIQSVQQFLFSINSTIHIPQLKSILPLRQNDRAIMDLPTTHNFSKSELEIINACRIYMQVTTLAEITNTQGNEILPCVLYGKMTTDNTPVLWKTSTSTLKWPNQTYPSKKSWTLWKRFLLLHYSNNYKIHPALGYWTTNCHIVRNWHYKTSGVNITYSTPQSTQLFMPQTSRTRNTKTYLRVQIDSPLSDNRAIPIIPTTITNHALTIQPNMQHNLIPHSYNTMKYEFWRVATNHIPATDNIKYASYVAEIQNDTINISAIIESNQETIYIQFTSPPQYQPTTLTANAFSCMCVLTHLVNTYTEPIKIQLTVSNIATKKQLLKSRFAINNSKSTYSTEWDTFKVASNLLNILGSQQVTIIVSTSNSNNGLKQQFPSLSKPSHSSQASIDISQPYLTVDDKRVAMDYQQAIRDKSTAHEFNKFISHKYNWTDTTINDIHWQSHGKAFSALSGRRYKTTCQLIHKWLPVNKSYSKASIGTAKLCPFCCSEEEDQIHFLSCNHIELKSAWDKASEVLYTRLHKYNKHIHHHLLKLLTLAITQWRTTTSPEVPNFLHPKFHSLFKNQSVIGWNQIINGRFSTQWAEAITSECTNPTNWLAYTISQIWQQVFEVWKHRCDKNHGTDKSTKHKRAMMRLTPQVESIFDQQHTSEQNDQYLFKNTMSAILQLPIPSIEQWIFKTHLRLKASAFQQRQKSKRLLSIHPFFSNLHQQNGHKPRKHSTKYKHSHRKFLPTFVQNFFRYISNTSLPTDPTSTEPEDLYPP
jgi:hypothetical protein